MRPDETDDWLSKLRWRLDHRFAGPAMRAIAELSPARDPEVIRALIEALSFRDQGVREAATGVLDLSGNRFALGEVWTEAAAALRAAYLARS